MHYHDIRLNRISCGIVQVEYWSLEFPAPAAIMWVQTLEGDGNIVTSILHAYTLPWARRRGFASALVEFIQRDCHVVSTLYGSDAGGSAFLHARGFKFCDASQAWVLPGGLQPKAKSRRRKR